MNWPKKYPESFYLLKKNAVICTHNFLERCPSGWRSKPGKFVCGQLHRGFESHPLCIVYNAPDREHFLCLFAPQNSVLEKQQRHKKCRMQCVHCKRYQFPLPGITGKNLWFLEVIPSSKAENSKCRRRFCKSHKKLVKRIKCRRRLWIVKKHQF